jgi:nucleoside-diphosphate-sugar epimerase
MIKVAVTGSNGFIGKFLVKSLMDNGFEVLRGTHKNADVTNKKALEKFIKKSDTVVHLAAYQNVFDRSYDNFEKVNVEGTRNILELAKKYNKKVILFSSEVVFRNSTDFYTKSKKAQLKLAEKYKNVEIVYPPVVLNLKQKLPWWKLMPGGIMMAIGDGNKMINFIKISDLCRYIVKMLKATNKEPMPVQTMTKKEYLQKIRAMTGGFKMPFLIPIWIIKLLLVILRLTKYRILLESIIENEK